MAPGCFGNDPPSACTLSTSMLRVRLGTFQRLRYCRSALWLNRTRRLMLTRSDLTIVMKNTVTVRPLPPVG
jgi:hypothetical protein